ncbi:uncharacterized protein UTRI_01532 [Ustilago trichophora]|uniref:Uncharacterized protein n=1 Tax=Ustilago trichophora TaxID=86804 RepID=A0A5C3DWK3_9BASI|nr:uncharacterized protein UTRI_01532 [Ustilago trichophora]
MTRVKQPLWLIGFVWMSIFLFSWSHSGEEIGVYARAVSADKPQRDLFDQLLHKYLPGGDSLQWSVHPLPRGVEKRQISMLPQTAAGNSGVSGNGNDALPGGGLVGLMGGGGGSAGNAGNAVPASVLAAAAAASPTNSASGNNDASSASGGANAASSTPGSDRSPSSASATPPASSSAPVPLSKIITSPTAPSSASSASNLASSASNPASTASSSTTPSATPTKASQQSDDPPDNSNVSLLSPKHKLFPLIVAGLACAGILAIMLLIAIARAIAHDQLRRDNLKKSYSFDSTCPSSSSCSSGKKNSSSDRFTSSPPGVNAARSLRRAMTKKKLGSFARRTQDGSVLIEVGDEVFAVPPHLADSYRERILREKRSRSDLSSNKGDGLFGSVRPKFLTDGGPDGGDEEQARAAYDSMLQDGGGVDGAGGVVRRSLSQRITDRLRSLTAASTGATEVRPSMVERNAYSFNTITQQPGALRQSNLGTQNPVLTTASSGWAIQPSCSAEMHKTPAAFKAGEPFGTARVLLPRTSSSQAMPQHSQPSSVPVGVPAAAAAAAVKKDTVKIKPHSRKPPPKLELSLLTEKLADLEKKSCSSSSCSSVSCTNGTSKLPKEASMTHSSSIVSGDGTFGGSQVSVPGAFPERQKSLHHSARRARSIKPLILNMEEPSSSSTTTRAVGVGTYRGRQAEAHRSKTQIRPEHHKSKSTTLERKNTTSVGLASPTRFTHHVPAKLVINPTKPELAATSGASFRPLPVPPPFGLPK